MKAEGWWDTGEVLIEIGSRSVRLRHGGRELVVSLERGKEGGLTAEGRARVVREVGAWLDRKPWQPRPRAWCLMPVSGVSLRRWRLPVAGSGGLGDLVRLKIEAEFPVSPEELAWGWSDLGAVGGTGEVLVVAMKRALFDEHAAWVGEAGMTPVFGVAALGRQGLVSDRSRGYVLVDVAAEAAELLVADELGPVRLRTVGLGEGAMIRVLAEGVGVEPGVVTAALEDWERGGTTAAIDGAGLALVAERMWEPVVTVVLSSRPGGTVFLTGSRRLSPVLVEALQRRLGAAYSVEVLHREGVGGCSGAVRGLGGLKESGRLTLVPEIRPQVTEAESPLARKAPRRWAVVAAVGLLAVVGLPYLEAMLLYPGLAARVASVKAKQDRMQLIDREADFLRYLKQNRSAHLDTLLVLGKSSPPGARIDSFALNRKGELSLRISMRQPPEVAAFRNKLVESGFFSNVVVEEQSPSPDRQKLLVRLSAQLRAAAEREGLTILSTNEPAGGKPAGGPAGGPGMPPTGMPVPGMPMPMPMPMPPGRGPG